MDRYPHLDRLLADATTDQLLAVREASSRTGMGDLARAAETELRRRATVQLENRLRPYRVTLKRIV